MRATERQALAGAQLQDASEALGKAIAAAAQAAQQASLVNLAGLACDLEKVRILFQCCAASPSTFTAAAIREGLQLSTSPRFGTLQKFLKNATLGQAVVSAAEHLLERKAGDAIAVAKLDKATAMLQAEGMLVAEHQVVKNKAVCRHSAAARNGVCIRVLTESASTVHEDRGLRTRPLPHARISMARERSPPPVVFSLAGSPCGEAPGGMSPNEDLARGPCSGLVLSVVPYHGFHVRPSVKKLIRLGPVGRLRAGNLVLRGISPLPEPWGGQQRFPSCQDYGPSPILPRPCPLPPSSHRHSMPSSVCSFRPTHLPTPWSLRRPRRLPPCSSPAPSRSLQASTAGLRRFVSARAPGAKFASSGRPQETFGLPRGTASQEEAVRPSAGKVERAGSSFLSRGQGLPR